MGKSVKNGKSYKWLIAFVVIVMVCAAGSYFKGRYDRSIVIYGHTPVNQENYDELITEAVNRKPITVNVNTATAEELCKVPNITPRIARNIIDFREALGRIADISDIQYVPGIGKTVYEEIGAYLTVE